MGAGDIIDPYQLVAPSSDDLSAADFESKVDVVAAPDLVVYEAPLAEFLACVDKASFLSQAKSRVTSRQPTISRALTLANAPKLGHAKSHKNSIRLSHSPLGAEPEAEPDAQLPPPQVPPLRFATRRHPAARTARQDLAQLLEPGT